jgi:prepilin-type N-terminal cleavage/methylation domain-containing protein
MRASALSVSLRRRAFTLVEAVVVLAIVGLVLGSIWAATSVVRRGTSAQNTVHHVAVVAQNIRKLYSGRSAFTSAPGSDITEMLVNSGSFPREMFEDPGSVIPRTDFGTPVRVLVTTFTQFQIVLDPNIPSDVCSSILTKTTGTGRDPGLVGVVVNGVAYNDLSAMGVSTIPANCSSITFTFNLS